MATFAEIEEVRLRINDPEGFIDLEEVSTLPSSPAHQTAYKLTTDGVYYATEEESPIVPDDYDKLDLQVSDSRISIWIDTDGIGYATCQALKQIISQLRSQLAFISNDSGVESTQYNTLKDTYDFYKDLLKKCKEQNREDNNNSTGRYAMMKQPEIAGGNL